jgi:16S rRNA G1207 methylase RsmC
VKAGGVAEPGVFSPLALATQLDRDVAEASQRVAIIRARMKPSPTLAVHGKSRCVIEGVAGRFVGVGCVAKWIPKRTCCA